MGRFAFVPGAGQRYHARLTLPDGGTADYPLPAAQPSRLHPARSRKCGTEFLVEARYRGAGRCAGARPRAAA